MRRAICAQQRDSASPRNRCAGDVAAATALRREPDGASGLLSDIGLFSALKSRMHWLQARQGVLAENVANADTPLYRARDMEAFELPERTSVPKPGAVVAVRTDAAHFASTGDDPRWRHEKVPTFEVKPAGNSVVLEEEMMKVTQTQIDYQLATSLYTRSIGLLKTALGRRA